MTAFVNTSENVSITMSSSIYLSLAIYIWLFLPRLQQILITTNLIMKTKNKSNLKSKRKVVIRNMFFLLKPLLYNYVQLLNFYEKLTKNYWILPNTFVNFQINVTLSPRFEGHSKLFSLITTVANLTNSIEQQKR